MVHPSCIAAGGLAASLTGAAPTAPTPRPVAAPPVTVRAVLERVTELRRIDLVAEDSGGFSTFDQPGLELRFGLEAPEGRKIVELGEPIDFEATDDAGADLTSIPKNIFGRREHVQTIHEWEQPPHAFTFKLALPAQSASTFSLTARLDAVTYLDTQIVTLRPTSRPQVLAPDLLDGQEVTVALAPHKHSVHVVFTPARARPLIESVELRHGATKLEDQGTMWNERQVGFMFTAAPDADQALEATITLRKGLQTVPVEIRLADHPLP